MAPLRVLPSLRRRVAPAKPSDAARPATESPVQGQQMDFRRAVRPLAAGQFPAAAKESAAAGEKSRLSAFRYRVPNQLQQRRSNLVVPSGLPVFREPKGQALFDRQSAVPAARLA